MSARRRTGMTRIPFETVVAAPFERVIRMAEWMGVAPVRRQGESDGSYRRRCAVAICRVERKITVGDFGSKPGQS